MNVNSNLRIPMFKPSLKEGARDRTILLILHIGKCGSERKVS